MSMQKDAGQVLMSKNELFDAHIDIGGRDIIIGFNEPSFRKSSEELAFGDLDAKLNARFPSYFLPAVQLAAMQEKRPRLVVVSGIFAAFKWSAQNEEQRRVMLADNNLKIDFLQRLFQTFFPDTFSIVDFRQGFDFLKFSDHTLDRIWSYFEKRYPDRLSAVKKKLAQYKNPKLFADGVPSDEILEEYFIKSNESLKTAFRYALVHVFLFADINIGWDFAHNTKGYCSIGEHNEATFNVVRDMGFEVLSEVGEIIFDQPVYAFDNLRIVMEDEVKAPPAYNGATRKSGNKQWIDEVTYENAEPLSYYDSRPKLKPSMDYLYRLIPAEKYTAFWDDYRDRYVDLKKRYIEAFEIGRDF